MKKVLYIFAAVALLLGVVSCQKNKDEDPEEPITTQQAGVYNPGMKISRIYYQNEGKEKKLKEVWRWKGNKLIEIQIQGGDERYSYTYQNNRLSKMDVYYGNDLKGTAVYYYEGANFSKVEIYYEGELVEVDEFDYKNLKISSIYVYPNEKTANKVCNKLEQSDYSPFVKFKSSSKKKNVIDFTWDGDNVSTIYGGDGYDDTYTYDGKNNPYYGSFMFLFDADVWGLAETLSKNNVTTEYHDGKLWYEYSYEYNSKGYPVKKIQTVYQSNGTIAATHTYYYEYLED